VDESWEYNDRCIDLNGANSMAPAAYLENTIIPHYREKDDTDRLIKLYIRLSQIDSKDYESLIELAKLYQKNGNMEKAAEAVDKAIAANPSIKESAERFKSELGK
jgi:tetratricopeptide (TPR) repeat protein